MRLAPFRFGLSLLAVVGLAAASHLACVPSEFAELAGLLQNDPSLEARPNSVDLEASWKAIPDSTEARALGLDVPLLEDLNVEAAAVFRDWLECQRGNIKALRLSYFGDSDYCGSDRSRGDSIRARIGQLRGNLQNALATSMMVNPDLDPAYRLPERLGYFSPLIIQFLVESLASHPIYFQDAGRAAVDSYSLRARVGETVVLVSNWKLRNALLLLSLVPNEDIGSWGMFPRLNSYIGHSLQVSPVLDRLAKPGLERLDGYRLGIGDIRELLRSTVHERIKPVCGAVPDLRYGLADPLFDNSSKIIRLYRGWSAR